MNQNLQLIVPNGGSVDATMKLMWCLTPALSVTLTEAKAKNPMIVFQVSPIVDSDSEYAANTGERQIVPLDQLQNYFWFRRSGKHLITAFIVWNNTEVEVSKKTRKELFAKDANGNFAHTVGEMFYTHVEGGEIEIEVSDRFFAKKPPAWLSAFVNLPYQDDPRDSCHFEKRLLMSWLTTPLAMAFITVYVTVKVLLSLGVVAALLIAGQRNINFRPLIHPADMSYKDVYSDLGESVFLFDSQGKKRRGILAILYPPRLIVIFVMVRIVMTIGSTLLQLLGLVIAALLIGWAREVWRERRKKIVAQEEAEAESSRGAYYMALARSPSNDNGALPQGRRSIALVVQELKAKSCRPYAIE